MKCSRFIVYIHKITQVGIRTFINGPNLCGLIYPNTEWKQLSKSEFHPLEMLIIYQGDNGGVILNSFTDARNILLLHSIDEIFPLTYTT